MEITQGATVLLTFPCTRDGVDLDLTTLTDVCFVLSGAGHKITKKSGDAGWAIVSYGSGTDNALSITLAPAETSPLQRGRLYQYWVWGSGADGDDVMVNGWATVNYAEKCT